MGIREHRGAIEAILFSSGEPVSAERISAVIEVDVKTVHKLIAQLIDEYESRDGGVLILKLGTSYQMVSNKEYGSFVRTALDMRRNVPLSQAALEVLAIVAYNQPITKSFMEQIRGVDCSGVVSTLCEKELIEEAGRMDLPGRPISYKTTANFLRCFGISSLDMLPALPQKATTAERTEAIESIAEPVGEE